LITDPNSGERLGEYDDIDYTSAMERVYRKIGFRTKDAAPSEWDLVQDMMHGTFDGGPGSGNFGHAGRPGEVGGSAPSGSSSSNVKYYGKVGTVKYKDLEYEVDKDGNIVSGPEAFIEGLKHPKKPGENIEQGDIVVYAPEWRSEGESKYQSVVLEERGDLLLIGTLNHNGVLGRTEVVEREMVQSIGYNAGVSGDYTTSNDPIRGNTAKGKAKIEHRRESLANLKERFSTHASLDPRLKEDGEMIIEHYSKLVANPKEFKTTYKKDIADYKHKYEFSKRSAEQAANEERWAAEDVNLNNMEKAKNRINLIESIVDTVGREILNE
jgi:hypothetical protein